MLFSVRGLSAALGVLGILAMAACTPTTILPGKGPRQQGAGTGTDGKMKVGLLVPLSGKYRATGQMLLEGAQLALSSPAASGIELLPRNCCATPDQAREEASRLVSDGARVIAGPLLSSSVPAVAGATSRNGIPVLAFSNDPAVAGGNVHIMGFSLDDQVVRMLSFARQRGYTRTIALVPDSPYGQMIAHSLADQPGIRTERFPADSPGIQALTKRLASERQSFDSVLMAASGDTLRQLASFLTYYGVDTRKVRFMGNSQWDNPSLWQEGALRGAWFTAPHPNGWKAFAEQFRSTFGKTPLRLASLSHDAVLVAAEAGDLEKAEGFRGVDGTVRFLPDGRTRRDWSILEIRPEGPAVIDSGESR
ncbi:MAG: penicillin-binding protein activator [Pseudomonadota bacterium]|nr:penicillin-binding protein activator [Pseudomonadota bacterium]